MVFLGQGSQWPKMAADLLARPGVFADHIAACQRAMDRYLDWSLAEVLTGEPGAPPLDRLDVVQPALFAVMTGLAALWAEHGITPQAVAGHSQGEISAAYTAGILTLDDAAAVVALRSKAMLPLMGQGETANVELSAQQAAELIAAWDGELDIAAINSPTTTVISGTPAAVAAMAQVCQDRSIRVSVLSIGCTAHSRQVEELREDILTALDHIRPRPGRIPLYSALTGALVEGTAMAAGYWYSSLRNTVRFEAVTRALAADGHTVFIESSPHPVLTAPIEQTLEDNPVPVLTLATLRRGRGGPSALAAAGAPGLPVVWSADNPARPARQDLPTYPFQRQTYWLRSAVPTASLTQHGQAEAGHPILTAAIDQPDGTVIYTGRVSATAHPWTGDHAVTGTVLLPGTAFVDMTVHTGTLAGTPHIADLAIEAPLIIGLGQALTVQAVLDPPGQDGARMLAMYSRPGPDALWTRHVTGQLTRDPDSARPQFPDLTAWPPPGAVPLDSSGLYDAFAATGVEYGPAFQECPRRLASSKRHRLR